MLLAGLGACADVTTAPDVVITDSAGVTMVFNSPNQLSGVAHWVLSSKPVRTLHSSDESDFAFFRVVAVLPLDGGGTAVLNAGTYEILLLNESGELLGSFGQEGDGPGEFRGPNSLLRLPADSLGVYDSEHKRFSVFSRNGLLGREFTLDPVPTGSAYERLLPIGAGDLAVFSDGGLGGGKEHGVFRAESESVLLDSDGGQKASYGNFPGSENFVGVGPGAGRVVFGAASYATTTGEVFVVGTGGLPEIRYYGPTGALSMIVRWPDHDRTVTSEQFEAYVEGALATLPESDRKQARRMLSGMPRSDTQPAYEELLSSEQGHIWIGDYRGPEMALPGSRSPQREWLVFDEHGTLIASVRTPAGFSPLTITGGEVLGVYVDDQGVESIRVYELIT